MLIKGQSNFENEDKKIKVKAEVKERENCFKISLSCIYQSLPQPGNLITLLIIFVIILIIGISGARTCSNMPLAGFIFLFNVRQRCPGIEKTGKREEQ